MKETTLGILLLLVIAISLPACAAPLQYVIEPMEARVVDATTKQPLERVVVVAHWELEHGTVGGNVPSGQLRVMETVTDKDGRFAFPGFGPETLVNRFLVNRDPRLIIFKPGYEYRGLSNAYTSDRELRTRRERRSDWNGKTIELKPFAGTTREYAEHLDFMTTSLESVLFEECGWKKIPRMVLAVNGQSEIFRKNGLYGLPSIESLEIRYSNVRARCGSVKEFFRSYQP